MIQNYLKIIVAFTMIFFVAQQLFHKPLQLALMVLALLVVGYVTLAKILPNPRASVTFFYLSLITLVLYFEVSPLIAVAVSVFFAVIAKIAMDAKGLKYISQPESEA